MKAPALLQFHNLTPIGYVDGQPVWHAQGGRAGGGLSFLVDDKDGDEPDEFDEEEADEADEDDGEPEDELDDPRDRRRQRQRDDEPDDGEQDDADADWEPPSREQWDRVQAAMGRNNNELRKRRMAGKIFEKVGLTSDEDFSDWLLDRGIDPETGHRIEGLADDGDEAAQGRQVVSQRRAEERGRLRAEGMYQPALIQFAAAAALRDADYTGKDVGPILRMLDTEKIEVEFEHGEPIIYGLEDQIAELKKELPQLFRAKRTDDTEEGARRTNRTGGRSSTGRTNGTGRTGARQVDGGDRGKPAARSIGWLEKADRQLRGLPAEPPRGRR